MNNDYIKLNRSILEWEWWADINTTRLFLYMLLKANWKDGKFKGIDVPRGSFISSIAKLSEGTGLSSDEVRTAIGHLVKSNTITKQSTSRFTLFSLVNYDLYQDISQTTSQSSPKQSPSKPQTIPKLFPTIEEKKEGKNISLSDCARDVPLSRFMEFWNAYPKKVNMLNAQGEYTFVLETTADLTEDDLVSSAVNYADACRIKHTKDQYMKNPENWLKESVWIDYLPANYKRPAEHERSSKTKKNSFNNFDQRSYDYDQMEKLLLEKQGE